MRRRVRWAVIRGLALLFSLMLFVLTGEAALRVIYRDGGRTTLGGPGARSFEHLATGEEELRGRRDVGPRRPGVPRMMIIGDSITYGQGVRDWRDTWPEQLASRLEREGRPHEMAVFALPGQGIADHVTTIEREGPRVRPDVIFYQWYVNDLEIVSERPDATRSWQRWSGHQPLRATSYLYYFLDNRAASWLPAPTRSYVDYILQDFAPGTRDWAEFERVLHTFVTRARELASRCVVLLYPQVPYGKAYPLKPVHDRMRALAGPHLLVIPPAAWKRHGGTLEADSTAAWKQALRVPAAFVGPIVDTGAYLFAPGDIDVEITVGVGDAVQDPVVAILELRDTDSDELLSSLPVRVRPQGSGFQRVRIRASVPGTRARHVRARLEAAGHESWRLAEIAVHVDYGTEMIDLAEALNGFNTHASIFDAHPNEAAHRVLAEEAYRALNASRAQ